MEILQIKDILRHSECPFESLRATFDRFDAIDDGKLFFDGSQLLWEVTAAKFAAKGFDDVIKTLDVVNQLHIVVI